MKKYLYFLNCIVFFIGSYYQSTAQIITTAAGNGLAGYSGDGAAATLAKLYYPTCLAMDLAGNLYINVQRSHAVRKVNPAGVITTVAGKGSPGFSGDNGPATDAELNGNWGMTADGAGNVYICDQNNHRIRKVNTAGIITTIAGTDTAGFSGNGGPATAARIKTPNGIAVDAAGNIYFGESDNRCIRKINTSGIISTYAGTPGSYGYTGDGGPALAAKLKFVLGIALDAAGNLYLCDVESHTVRKVDVSGNISTIAGTGSSGYSGDGGPATGAKLNQPIGVYAAPDGRVFIVDYGNNVMRVIDNAGIIKTFAGTGLPGYNGDGIPATSAQLNQPIGVVLDPEGSVYVADLQNERVRKVINVLSFIGGDSEPLAVCQNAGPVPVNAQLAVRDVYMGLTDVWSLHTPPAHGTAAVSYSTLSTGGVITPAGLTYTPHTGYVGPDSFQVKVENSLSFDIITIYVTIDPLLVPGPVAGKSEVCVGDTIIVSTSLPGGLWSTANGSVQVNPLLTSCVVKGLRPGIDTIFYQVINACGAVISQKEVTVNPLPDPGSISGPNGICFGSVATFTANVAGGTWATSNLNTAVVGTTAITSNIRGVTPGPSTVIHMVSNAWCTAAAIKQVEVEIFPDAGKITGPVSVCLGAEITLTDTVPGGIWSNDSIFTSVVYGVVTGVAIGSDYINYSVTNSCGTDVTTWPVTVFPVPDAPPVNFDQGILSVPKGYASYQWKRNGTDIPGAHADTLYADVTGVYQVVVTNSFGCPIGSAYYDHTGCSPDELVLFPNPAKNLVQIMWCKKVTVRIMAADGREVGVAEDVNQVDISNLAAGVYMFTFFDNTGTRIKTGKVVKQ